MKNWIILCWYVYVLDLKNDFVFVDETYYVYTFYNSKRGPTFIYNKKIIHYIDKCICAECVEVMYNPSIMSVKCVANGHVNLSTINVTSTK